MKPLFPKKNLFPPGAFALLKPCFLFCIRAYKKIIRRPAVTNGVNTFYITFRKLSRDVINVVLFNPHFIRSIYFSKIVKLFRTGSQWVIQRIGFLKSPVGDPINIQFAGKLPTLSKSALFRVVNSMC